MGRGGSEFGGVSTGKSHRANWQASSVVRTPLLSQKHAPGLLALSKQRRQLVEKLWRAIQGVGEEQSQLAVLRRRRGDTQLIQDLTSLLPRCMTWSLWWERARRSHATIRASLFVLDLNTSTCLDGRVCCGI